MDWIFFREITIAGIELGDAVFHFENYCDFVFVAFKIRTFCSEIYNNVIFDVKIVILASFCKSTNVLSAVSV